MNYMGHDNISSEATHLKKKSNIGTITIFAVKHSLVLNVFLDSDNL